MSAAPRIVMGGALPSTEPRLKLAAPPDDHQQRLGWTLLGWVGLGFVAIGVLDLAVGWLPPHFGNPEWEFGTVAHTLDGLPITVLGLAMVLASAVERRVRWGVRAASLAAWALAAMLAAALVLFLLDVPVALRAVIDPVAKTGLRRAILKALVQGLVYPSVLLAIGWQGARATRRVRALV